MLALDTNLLVRLLTNDEPAQALKVQQTLNLELQEGRPCLVGQIVLCELVWMLRKLYGYSLEQCQGTVDTLLAFSDLRFEALPEMLAATRAWRQHGGDFADHLLGQRMLNLGCESVLTFDKKAAQAPTHRLLASTPLNQ